MYEFAVPEEHHITTPQNPARLFPLTIGLLGDLAAQSNVRETEPGDLSEQKKTLVFAARFFDAYLQTRLNQSLDAYVLLLGASSYYLCDLPGSSKVLANELGETCPDLGGHGTEDLLLWLLRGSFEFYFDGTLGLFGSHVDGNLKATR